MRVLDSIQLQQYLKLTDICLNLDIELGNFTGTFDMASKRDRDSSGTPSGPPAKKPMTQFEPVKIGPIYSLVSSAFVKCIIYFCK